MHQVILSLGFGLVTASILAMGAVGFTLQFGVTNLFNLAYGDVMTVSAFVGYIVHNTAGVNIWVTMLAGGAAGAVLSLLLARGIYLPFLRRGAAPFVMVAVTVAVGLVMRDVLQAITGASFYGYQLPPQKSVHIAGMQFAPRQLVIMAIAVASMLALHLLFRYTRIGKAMRATSDDASLARGCGIATGRVIGVTWLASGFLCGIAGVALGIDLGTFDFTLGLSFLFIIVSAAVFGSVGEPYGAMVGALVIGIASEEAAIVAPDLKNVVAFAILVLVLLLRPEGLRRGRVRAAGEVGV